MSNERKKFIICAGLILIAGLLSYPLPHDSYSISDYIIPKIHFKNGSTVYLSGIIPVILLVIATRGIFKLEKYK